MTYRCLADLRGKILECGDNVVLKDILYVVRDSYLDCRKFFNNKIFQDLKIPKIEIAEQAYGYPPLTDDDHPNWPECKEGDYPALTRLVLKLYRIIEESSITYKITTPGKTGISPEQVKELIVKYGGVLDPNYNYKSPVGIYYWKRGGRVDVTSVKEPIYGAIEVSPTTEIITTKQEEKHESQFQRKKARIERGTQPKGNTVCGRRSKTSVTVGHLGYRKVTGI